MSSLAPREVATSREIDTHEGIEAALRTGLDGLHALIADRHQWAAGGARLTVSARGVGPGSDAMTPCVPTTTGCVCHVGSVCNDACEKGKHHDGCARCRCGKSVETDSDYCIECRIAIEREFDLENP